MAGQPTAQASRLRQYFDLARLGRMLLMLAPAAACYLYGGDSASMRAGFAGVWLMMVAEKMRPSLWLLLLQGGAIALSMGLFCAAFAIPWLFVLLCAVFGGVAVWLGRWGALWQSLGNYCFLPALYLGCELNADGARALAAYSDFLSWYALALVPPALVLLGKLAASEPRGLCGAVPVFLRRSGWLPPLQHDAARARVAGGAAIVRTAAVLLGALVVRHFGLPSGEWLIWSAASVVTGSLATAQRKAGDRVAGAVLGAGAGVALSWLALQLAPALLRDSHAVVAACTAVTAVSLGCCPHYRLAFGLRSMMCVVLAASAGAGYGAGLLRPENVLLGGLIGAGLTYGYERTLARQASHMNLS